MTIGSFMTCILTWMVAPGLLRLTGFVANDLVCKMSRRPSFAYLHGPSRRRARLSKGSCLLPVHQIVAYFEKIHEAVLCREENTNVCTAQAMDLACDSRDMSVTCLLHARTHVTK